MTPTTPRATAHDACNSAPEATLGTTPAGDAPTAHATPPMRDDRDPDADAAVYDDRTDDRPSP